MGDFNAVSRCTLGGDAFQLEDYRLSESPVIREGTGRVRTVKRVTGTGWIDSADVAGHASVLAAARDSFGVSGQDFRIYEFETEMVTFLAAQCLDGGPHVAFEFLEQIGDNALRRRVSFTVDAVEGIPDFSFNPATPIGQYTLRTETASDGLRRVTRSGQLDGAGGSAYFLTSVLPQFQAIYQPGMWVTTFSYETDALDKTLKYQIVAEELRSAFPTASGSTVKDGEAVERNSRDEQMRLIRTWDIDLLFDGPNVTAAINSIRQDIAAAGPIMRESVTVTQHRQTRVRMTFEQLFGGDGNSLLNWQQSFTIEAAQPTYEVISYPGIDPVLVQKPKGVMRITQSGSATGAGVWIDPPQAIYPETFLEQPRLIITWINDFECSSTWTYVMAVVDPSFKFNTLLLNKLGRPSQPGTITTA
jgi:hypothetical protein